MGIKDNDNPWYTLEMPTAEDAGREVGQLRWWEVRTYAAVRGLTMDEALEDSGLITFAMMPRNARGYALDLLLWSDSDDCGHKGVKRPDTIRWARKSNPNVPAPY